MPRRPRPEIEEVDRLFDRMILVCRVLKHYPRRDKRRQPLAAEIQHIIGRLGGPQIRKLAGNGERIQ